MKINYTLFALAVSAIGFTTSASAQTSATGQMTATAKLIKPIAITTGGLMSFGTLTTGNTGGDVTFNSNTDGGAFTPTLNAVTSLNSTPTAATFTVSGEAASTFTISLPVTAELSSVGETKLSLTDFKHNLLTTPTLDVNGEKVFQVAATLTIPANTTSGEYTTLQAMEVTVNYN